MQSSNISYSEALREALKQAMEIDPNVYVMGQLVDYEPGVFGTTTNLVDIFGSERVRDFPVSEAAMTSAAIGSVIVGMRPVLVHHRLDFMIYSLDAILNWMSLWRFKSNGKCSMPVVIRAVVGKGWGQGPQHSKSLHSWFANIPGLRVAIPSNAFDAKGMLLEAIFGENPTILIEHRSLFGIKNEVPNEPYRVKFGKAVTLKKGYDISFISFGIMVSFAINVANKLKIHGIDVEVIDLRTLSPLDKEAIQESVKKTKRICVFDPGWKSFGASSEIISTINESENIFLKSPPIRITYPDSHTPMSQALESLYYPNEEDVVNQILKLWNK